jgi:5'-3' exonuclease
MQVHLIDGTYELFRHFYALPSARDADGQEVAAVRGVVSSLFGMIRSGQATHLGVATDHVIESFRNKLWRWYKTSEGVPRVLLDQFPLLEEAVAAMGVAVWPMIEFEADDALASAARAAAEDPRVTRVVICTPDKDLAQCVVGTRVVQLNRRTRQEMDEAGVIRKFGVPPASIPDYLALVGDSSDGYPGTAGMGPEILGGRYSRVSAPGADSGRLAGMACNATGAARLAAALDEQRERAMLFRTLATLRSDIPLFDNVDDLRWTGPTPQFKALAARLTGRRPLTLTRGTDYCQELEKTFCMKDLKA